MNMRTREQQQFDKLMQSLEPGDLLHVPIYQTLSIHSTVDPAKSLSGSEQVPEPLIVYACILKVEDGILGLSDLALYENDLTPTFVASVIWDSTDMCFRTPDGDIPLWYSEGIVVEKQTRLDLVTAFRTEVVQAAEEILPTKPKKPFSMLF
jgi:hypothetical protein